MIIKIRNTERSALLAKLTHNLPRVITKIYSLAGLVHIARNDDKSL